ncbi:MAG: hypothetical protein WBB28_27890 [Crinalium sp.]
MTLPITLPQWQAYGYIRKWQNYGSRNIRQLLGLRQKPALTEILHQPPTDYARSFGVKLGCDYTNQACLS